jgi:hypothetical protein
MIERVRWTGKKSDYVGFSSNVLTQCHLVEMTWLKVTAHMLFHQLTLVKKVTQSNSCSMTICQMSACLS